MENCLKKYLEEINVKSHYELTDEQLINFFKGGYLDISAKYSAIMAMDNVRKGCLKYDDVIVSMRKSIKQKKRFICYHICNESADNNYKPKLKDGVYIEP